MCDDLLGTGSGNIASDIGQANAVGWRFVALSVIFVMFMFSVYLGSIFLVKC